MAAISSENAATLDLYMRRVGAQSERLGAENKRHP
jgi:hypothetical protein